MNLSNYGVMNDDEGCECWGVYVVELGGAKVADGCAEL